MALADDLRALIDPIRSIPGQMGLRPYRVFVIVRQRVGAYGLEGPETVELTREIVSAGGQPPKVRLVDDEEIALGGLAKGSLQVGPITPEYAGGGIAYSVLVGQATEFQTLLHYRVVGPAYPSGALFRLTNATHDRALHYTLVLSPIEGM